MITGVFFNTQAPKRFDVLKQVRPQSTRFGYLMNAGNPATPYIRKQVVAGARTIGIELEVIELKEMSELPAAFDRLSSLGVDGVGIGADPVFLSNPAHSLSLLFRINFRPWAMTPAMRRQGARSLVRRAASKRLALSGAAR
jgi:hypothetical protein